MVTVMEPSYVAGNNKSTLLHTYIINEAIYVCVCVCTHIPQTQGWV
jgi:hypothetical protein